MKNIKRLVLLSICLCTFLLSTKTYAQSIDNPIFTGEIIPKHSFMVGTIPTTADFTITGTIKSERLGDTSTNLTISWIDKRVNNEQTVYEVLVTGANSIARAFTTVTIDVIEFDPILKCELDNITMNIDRLFEYSEDGFDKIYYYSQLNLQIVNAVGQEIKGGFNFSENLYKPQIGYNTIAYRFEPYNIGNQIEYAPIYGNFQVYYETKPTITVTSSQIMVGLNNTQNDYKIKIGDRWYKSTQIKNLKPNTKYKVTIVQNATETTKAKVVYTKTVKTKSK